MTTRALIAALCCAALVGVPAAASAERPTSPNHPGLPGLSGATVWPLSQARGHAAPPSHAPARDSGSTFRPAPVSWQPCGAAECTTVPVPLDWSRPGGDRVTVAVARHRATGDRVGTLFINPGGPGGPAVDLVRDYLTEFFPPDLIARFDLIGMDQRGVGESVPAIACEVPTVDPKGTPTPGNQAEFDALVAYNREVALGCRRATGPLIDHVDTVSAAKDVDVVRAALGEDTISWLGLSYGSLLGSTYAELFPHRVRAAVLDGAMDHTVGTRRMALDEARVNERVFAEFARWCASDTSCDLHGRDVAAEYRDLLARAAVAPIPAKGVPGGVRAHQIGYAVYGGLNVRQTWPVVATVLRDALAPEPDATRLAAPASSPAYRVIACHDFPSDVRDFRDLSGRLAEIRSAAPVSGPYVEGWDVETGCAGWPIPPRNPWAPQHVCGARNVLVVSGANDPATPHEWGVGLVRQIEGARMLRWEGYGHTAYFNDRPTLDKEIQHLVAPPRGH